LIGLALFLTPRVFLICITVTRKNPKLVQDKQYWQKKKKKELLDFYQFQLRESKHQHIAELRQKFEELRQAEGCRNEK